MVVVFYYYVGKGDGVFYVFYYGYGFGVQSGFVYDRSIYFIVAIVGEDGVVASIEVFIVFEVFDGSFYCSEGVVFGGKNLFVGCEGLL